jgi:hypothetical protein
MIIFTNRPDIQHFLDKIKREKEAKLNAQENDNRPFILKYVSKKKNIYKKYFFIFSGNIYFQLSLYSSFKVLLQMVELVVMVVAADSSFFFFYIF